MANPEIISFLNKNQLTPKQLALALGLDPSYISLLINGKRKISDSFRYKLEKLHTDIKEGNVTFVTQVDSKTGNSITEDVAWRVKDPEGSVYEHIKAKKAKAGLSHVSNPNARIRQLIASAIDSFPEGNYDIWEVEGNSMLPSLCQGDKLLCRMIKLEELIDNRIYVIIVNKPELADYRKSGVWVKRLQHRKPNGYVNCKSDNKDTAEPFPTFRLKESELVEIWYPVMRMTFNMADPNRDIYDKLDELEGRIEMLESINE